MKNSNEPQGTSSFINCIMLHSSMNVDACRRLSCAAKFETLKAYEHGKPGELDD